MKSSPLIPDQMNIFVGDNPGKKAPCQPINMRPDYDCC